MERADRKHWTFLRVAVVAAGVAGTLFWIGSVVWWWRIPVNHRDGFELLGVMLATGFFVVLVLPTLILGLLGRWLIFAAVLGAIVVALDSDVLLPWIPWGSPLLPWNWF